MKEKFAVLWKKYVNYETISYLIVGVMTTAINWVANYVCYYYFHMGTLLSTTVSWVVAVIFAFFANKIFVFKSKEWGGKRFLFEFGSFTLARVLSYFLEAGFMLLTVEWLDIPNWIAKILVSVIVVVVNYFASKLVIFRKKKESD